MELRLINTPLSFDVQFWWYYWPLVPSCHFKISYEEQRLTSSPLSVAGFGSIELLIVPDRSISCCWLLAGTDITLATEEKHLTNWALTDCFFPWKLGKNKSKLLNHLRLSSRLSDSTAFAGSLHDKAASILQPLYSKTLWTNSSKTFLSAFSPINAGFGVIGKKKTQKYEIFKRESNLKSSADLQKSTLLFHSYCTLRVQRSRYTATNWLLLLTCVYAAAAAAASTASAASTTPDLMS